MVFETLLNPVFDPLLRLQSFWAIFILSLLITLIMTLIYKYFTDQKEMKRLKTDLKEQQAEMKKHKDDPKKMMAMQKKAMETNMKYMTKSFKPTLITFIPIIIIFGWMNANLAFLPLAPGADFTISAEFEEGKTGTALLSSEPNINMESAQAEIIEGVATWTLSGDIGEYILTINYDGQDYIKELKIDNFKYTKTVETFKKEPVKTITINNNPNKPLGKFSIFGWHPGWLGTYIILSLIMSLILRKLLKVV